jgi:hypothetical protein
VVVHRQRRNLAALGAATTNAGRLYETPLFADGPQRNAVQFFRDGKEITSALGISNDFYAFGVLDQFHNRVHIKAKVIER